MSVKSSVEVLPTLRVSVCNNCYRLQIVMLPSVACRWRLGEPIQQACQSPVIKDALNQDTSTPFSSAQAFTITAWQATGKQMSLQSRHLCCWWQAVGRKAYCVPTANELSDSLHHSQGLPVWQYDMIWTRMTSYQNMKFTLPLIEMVLSRWVVLDYVSTFFLLHFALNKKIYPLKYFRFNLITTHRDI